MLWDGEAVAPQFQPTLKLRQTPRPAQLRAAIGEPREMRRHAQRKRAALCIAPQRMNAFALHAAASMPIRFRFL